MAKLDIWDAALIGLISVHLMTAPYNKVEESFNTQAVYDFVNHGTELLKFDHLEFSGAVQRSFVGSFFYGTIVKFLKPYLIDADTPTQLPLQMVARGLLGLFNGLGFIILRHSVMDVVDLVSRNPKTYDVTTFYVASTTTTSSKHTEERLVEQQVEKSETCDHEKSSIGIWFALLQYTQFHLVFYSSRFLPNFIALPLTNMALGAAVRSNYPLACAILAFTAMVFRFEVFLLLGSLLFTSTIVFGKAPILPSISGSLFGASIGGLLSFFVDSHFWNPSVNVLDLLKDPSLGSIPEISSFIFNVVHKNAAKWGTMPFAAYFNVFFRKLFFPPAVVSLAPVGLLNDPTKLLYSVTIVGVACFLHVVLMSFQPHKEWRFIAYDIPGLTLLASAGASKFYKNISVSIFNRLIVLAVIASAGVSLISSYVMLYSSSLNYPGGVALDTFNNYIIERYENGTLPQSVTVHLDILPKMTGANLFGELQESYLNARNISIVYDKTENATVLANKWTDFDFLITDIDSSEGAYAIQDFDLQNRKALATAAGSQWFKISTINAFAGLSPRVLFVDNRFNPKEAFLQTAEQVLKHQSLAPVFQVIDQAIVTVPAIYIYEKQHLV